VVARPSPRPVSPDRPLTIAAAGDAPGRPDPRLFVGALAKGLEVLSAVAAAARPVGIPDVVTLTGLDRSAVQRLLYTLRAERFLRQDPQTKRYTLGPRVLDLAHGFQQGDALRRIALPFLDDLARRTEETINLTELDGSDVVYVVRIGSRHVVSVDLALGTRLPAWCTGPGRAILSRLTPAEIDQLVPAEPLPARTPRTLTHRSEVLKRIARAARDGFAVNDQEAFVGDISVAAPILDAQGRPVGAINIAVPFPRWALKQVVESLAPLVVDTAGRVSAELASR
jgi:IclR family pca regulon transcriptional regulator